MAALATTITYVAAYVDHYDKTHLCACFTSERAAAAWVLQKVLDDGKFSPIECEIHNTDCCDQCVIDIFDSEIKNPALNLVKLIGELSDYFDSWCGDGWNWSITSHVLLG